MPEKVFTIEQFYELGPEEAVNLLPEDFLRNEELFIRRYGEIHYNVFYSVIEVEESCLIKLKDGNALNYKNKEYVYNQKPGQQN